MPKTARDVAYRVVIEPHRIRDFRTLRDAATFLREYRQRCEDIVMAVKRHVDAVGLVYIDVETEVVCEFCHSRWTGDGDQFNGGCCKDDCNFDPKLLMS